MQGGETEKSVVSYQSTRVALLSVFSALSITMMAHKHGSIRQSSTQSTSLEKNPFDTESVYGMRKLLSADKGFRDLIELSTDPW